MAVAVFCSGSLATFGRLVLGAPAPAGGRALFREVPPEESGITWVHENALSPERYLPETTEAGTAFLDFDNDGSMDLYLVNSRPCDLYRRSPRLVRHQRHLAELPLDEPRRRALRGDRTSGRGGLRLSFRWS